jgi:tRNA threonylcarbamoyl adenosine modification protein (Sua5/YciO/YrdC/YwlC family)
MEIFQIKKKKDFSEAARIAVSYLKAGKVIVYPTDTVYGFGCDARNEEALRAIRRLKMREEEKPFSVVAQDLAMVKKYAILEKQKELFLTKLFPGKFTVILKSKNNLSKELTGKNKNLGIRIPDYFLTEEISKKFHDLYVTTSVNLSGENPEIEGDAIIKKFQRRFPRPDLVINAGILNNNGKKPLASTVIDLTGEKPHIIRLGVMNPQKLLGFLKAWEE